MTNPMVLDELDALAVDLYPGLVVRKDLLRRMRSSFSHMVQPPGEEWSASKSR